VALQVSFSTAFTVHNNYYDHLYYFMKTYLYCCHPYWQCPAKTPNSELFKFMAKL